MAHAAGFLIIRVDDGGARNDGGVIELGPLSTPDQVATIVCRFLCQRTGLRSERAVRGMLKERGFRYAIADAPRKVGISRGIKKRRVS
jgi:hypothetical protein